MRVEPHHRSNFSKVVITSAIFIGFAALTGTAPRAFADDCQKKVEHADHEFHKAAEKHGWNSPEAAKWRSELMSARQWCWDHDHRWWDEDAHAWRTEHWDEHDHMEPPH